MNKYPHLTVAVVCQNQNQEVLMVQEIDNGITCWNQPAGHVEPGEDLLTAALRETLEETQFQVELTGVLGVYQGMHQHSNTHFVRVCFVAEVISYQPEAKRDDDIIDVQWLHLPSLLEKKWPLRSELTRLCLEDLSSATIYPLSLIKTFIPRS